MFWSCANFNDRDGDFELNNASWLFTEACESRYPAMYSLRLAAPDDANAIRELTRAAYAKWIPVIGREPMPMIADYDKAVCEHRFDLMETGGELAALLETVDAGDHLLVENLAVAPAYQGKGLGKKLLAHAETIAASQGHRVLKLYSNKAFGSNVDFYLRSGYRIEREEPFMEGFTTYMEKSI